MALIKIPKEMGSTPGIVDNSNATAITIDSSENVGIGTASPQAKFSISNSGAEGIEFFPASASGQNSTQHYNRSGSAYLTNKQIALDHRFDTSGTERMRIDASGHLMLGVSSISDINSTYKSINVSHNQIMGSPANNDWYLNLNSYYTSSSNYKFKQDGFAVGMYHSGNGSLVFRKSSATGTAGNAVTWEESMRMTAAGKLVLDGTVPGYSGTQITVGSPSITTSGLSILTTTSGHGYLMFGDSTGDAAAGYIGQIHYDHADNSMDIVTNGVKACEFNNDGLQVANQVLASGRRRGMYGIYSPNKLAHIWGMGTAYTIATDGSTGNNLYGMCYSYEPNYGGAGNNPGARSGLGHQFQWRANGGTHTAIGNGIYTVGSVTANSDARLKTDIETIPNAMSKVSALTGITYKRTDLSEPDPATGFQKDVRHTGVIAQDLLAVLPEAVEGAIDGQQPEDGTYLSVAYGNMAGLFIEALKEQQATITALTARIETLENN